MITKLLAVKYPSFKDNSCHVFNINNSSQIKNTINITLFNQFESERYDYCLVNYNNKLYIIEPIDISKATYSRKEISYHPQSHLVS